jgi:hypothetical protein
MADTVRVLGYREFIRACGVMDRATNRELRGVFRDVGEVVRRDASSRLSDLSERSAAGYRTRVRQRGVEVEQSLRRTTGLRGDWGVTQMKDALVPALVENTDEVNRAMQDAMDNVTDFFALTARWQGQRILPLA